ncbi:MAG: SGNH/GDSL hydrolase family protein [Candidatus Sulfotelmatobacter sp.]|jgi:lysophospholipase L1-like esterase
MRIRLVSLSILVMLWGQTLAHAAARSNYYLALGDSLAIGVQPSASGEDVSTNQGYADDLYALFRTRMPRLGLAKLGCSGETTTTMIEGGICSSYAEGSQLAAAVSFLETHEVSLVTLDIGANDIDGCISSTGINATCVTTGLNTIGTNLPRILAELRNAAGPNTLIVAMNYYDPFLAAWTLGASGQTLAVASLQATTTFNGVLKTAYEAFSIPVADVATAYRISDFTLVPVINLPVNVFLTLTWTWMGAPAPIGPNIHPNAVGYAVIAGTFAEKIAPH